MLTVSLEDGRILQAQSAAHQKGSWRLPLDDSEFLTKFLGCAGMAMDEKRATSLYEMLMRLERLPSLRLLDKLMLTPP